MHVVSGAVPSTRMYTTPQTRPLLGVRSCSFPLLPAAPVHAPPCALAVPQLKPHKEGGTDKQGGMGAVAAYTATVDEYVPHLSREGEFVERPDQRLGESSSF